MKFSAVIPVYNGSRTLSACLEALAAQQYRDFEVLLVDNNSKDDSVDIIRHFLAAHPDFPGQLLHEPRQGACAARNTGAQATTGQVIANIDPDCLPDPAWLTDLAAAFADGEAAAVAGNIESRAPENIYESFAALYTLLGRSQVEELKRGGIQVSTGQMKYADDNDLLIPILPGKADTLGDRGVRKARRWRS